MVTYVENPAGMVRVLRGADGPVVQHLIRLGREVRAEAEARAAAQLQVRTGDYAGSFVGPDLGEGAQGPSVTVGNEDRKALWIEEGTAPHVIVPRRPGYPLRFQVGGVTVYAYRVRHPGTAAQHVLTGALEAVVR